MAAKIYAAESSVYRTVGLFESHMSTLTEEQVKDGKAVAASIAEYAIECSLNKVFGSEVLDYVVDEGFKSTVVTDLWQSTRLKECTVILVLTVFSKERTKLTV